MERSTCFTNQQNIIHLNSPTKYIPARGNDSNSPSGFVQKYKAQREGDAFADKSSEENTEN